MTNEYQMVCAHYGDDGHQQHRWPKGTEARVEQAVIDANHKAEMGHPAYVYQGCAPYRAQYRPLMDWADLGVVKTELLPYEADHAG